MKQMMKKKRWRERGGERGKGKETSGKQNGTRKVLCIVNLPIFIHLSLLKRKRFPAQGQLEAERKSWYMSGDVCFEVGESESSVLGQVNSASGNLSFSPHPQTSCSVAAPGQLLRSGNLFSVSYSAAVDLLHAVYLSKSILENAPS